MVIETGGIMVHMVDTFRTFMLAYLNPAPLPIGETTCKTF